MTILTALQIPSLLDNSQIQRLQDAGMLSGCNLTPMGERFKDGIPSEADLAFLKKKFDEWYCHIPDKCIAKSPIDCGHR